MNIERSAGILLHPTSLPGKFGIGDLGSNAYSFVDFLKSRTSRLLSAKALSSEVTGTSAEDMREKTDLNNSYTLKAIL